MANRAGTRVQLDVKLTSPTSPGHNGQSRSCIARVVGPLAVALITGAACSRTTTIGAPSLANTTSTTIATASRVDVFTVVGNVMPDVTPRNTNSTSVVHEVASSNGSSPNATAYLSAAIALVAASVAIGTGLVAPRLRHRKCNSRNDVTVSQRSAAEVKPTAEVVSFDDVLRAPPRRLTSIRATAVRFGSVQRDTADLVRVGDIAVSRWVNHELAELARRLRPADVRSTPVAVEISVEHGMELLWDEPNLVALEPWKAADGGWSWRLVYDAELLLPADIEDAPSPGLVAVGTRNDRTLFINLEALGSLAVTGDIAAAARFIRSLILEIAPSDDLTNICLYVVGNDFSLDHGLSDLSHATETEAMFRISALRDDHERILHEHCLDTSFALRVGGGLNKLEFTVVIAQVAQVTDVSKMLDLASPNRGVALILLGDAPARSTLMIEADGSAILEPLGLRFDATNPAAATEAAVLTLLDLAGSDGECEHPTRLVDASPNESACEPTRSTFDEEPSGPDGWELPIPDLLVRVLGTPRVDGHPNLGPLDVSLVAFLACNGGHATQDQLVNAVWGGRAIEKATLWNRVSKARLSLGASLPAREQGSSIIRLADGVTTDLELMKMLAGRADQVLSGDAIELLRRAVAFIDGAPFDAAGFDWSYEHQFNADACELIERVCVCLTELALQQDDLETARRAVIQGLRALPLNEPLYRWRMRIEANVGNRAGVRAAYTELCSRLSELGEAVVPSVSTSTLYEQLWSESPELRTA